MKKLLLSLGALSAVVAPVAAVVACGSTGSNGTNPGGTFQTTATSTLTKVDLAAVKQNAAFERNDWVKALGVPATKVSGGSQGGVTTYTWNATDLTLKSVDTNGDVTVTTTLTITPKEAAPVVAPVVASGSTDSKDTTYKVSSITGNTVMSSTSLDEAKVSIISFNVKDKIAAATLTNNPEITFVSETKYKVDSSKEKTQVFNYQILVVAEDGSKLVANTGTKELLDDTIQLFASQAKLEAILKAALPVAIFDKVLDSTMAIGDTSKSAGIDSGVSHLLTATNPVSLSADTALFKINTFK